MLDAHASLFEVVDRAKVVDGVKAGFSGHEEHWDAEEIDELPYGVRLQQARRSGGSRHADLRRFQVHAGVAHRRVVRHGDVRQPKLPRRGREQDVLKRRTGGLQGDDRLYQAWPHVRDQPGHQPALGVGDEDRGSNAIEESSACSLHCNLLRGGIGRELDIGRVVRIECRVAHHPGLNPCFCLRERGEKKF